MSGAATGTTAGPAAPEAPSVGWASGPLGVVQAAQREAGRQLARRARAVAAFAATRPTSADRPAGTPGAMSAERRAARPEVLADVSEWAAQELVVALSISPVAAENLLERSLTLVHRLPRVLAALESGLIHEGHLWSLLEKVAPIRDAAIRARVEREVLEWVAGRSVTTPPQLGAKVRRSVLRHDAAAAAQRLARALRERGVSVRADRREGMAVFDALITVPEAQALLDVLGQYADAIDDPDDPRTRGQKMADCLLDLVLRPGEHDGPPVRARLTVVAGIATLLGGDQPGEIGGEPVPAEVVRALARALGLLPDAAPDPGGPAAAPDPGGAPPAAGWLFDEPPVEAWNDAMRAADERWWTEVEARALRGEWGGEEDPPLEVLERWWAEQARRSGPTPPDDDWTPPDAEPPTEATDSRPPTPPADPASDVDATPSADAASPVDAAPPGTPTSPPDGADASPGWARADRAVDEASAALLELQRAVGRADRAVAAAGRAAADDDAAWEDGPAGRMTRARGAIDALVAATAGQREALAALLERTAGGGLLDRPRIAIVDDLSGALLALTDSTELCALATCGDDSCRRDPARCDHDLGDRPGLGPPPPSSGYRPGAKLDRFLRARDRRCRQPGCRRRVPLGGELDHDRPWPDGPTSAGNLAGYCTGHHRGKHQAPGWQHHLSEDGTLTVVTPSGLVATTTPPPF
ncbi:DUF222 domain-containing protein [Blastococcus sp. TML/M2B]|uniref:HNH endonuclease n=1 Tax=unclassified Blastococcus TaxID=2619396 RepID=UPI0019099170|nr:MULTISPECIES: HNH endonuclease [unclassified Blastococcus]MBN1093619.1 DUF222 domain-containing protein [Blastococcus sp. TML/M2B]MBN1096262.1 DUF222 domain-containing protein [Blastococcus sp. TML/C7B]